MLRDTVISRGMPASIGYYVVVFIGLIPRFVAGATYLFAISILGVISVSIKIWTSGGWCFSVAKLNGKTAIITGSNSGIGKETARDFVKRGARVILACRNIQKASKAAKEIVASSKSGEVVAHQLDLSSFTSIRNFAKNILETERSIDILVNNAGLIISKSITEDGFDRTFTTNHLGPFLLTNLLLEKIKSSSPARIIVVSSGIHKRCTMNWDDLNLNEPGSYRAWSAYKQSKLANMLFAKALSQKLKGTDVNVYVVNPGIVGKDFFRHVLSNNLIRLLWNLFSTIIAPLFVKTPFEGAQTSIYCSVSDDVRQQNGLYYSDCAIDKASKEATNGKLAKRLWDSSLEMVGLNDDEITHL